MSRSGTPSLASAEARLAQPRPDTHHRRQPAECCVEIARRFQATHPGAQRQERTVRQREAEDCRGRRPVRSRDHRRPAVAGRGQVAPGSPALITGWGGRKNCRRKSSASNPRPSPRSRRWGSPSSGSMPSLALTDALRPDELQVTGSGWSENLVTWSSDGVLQVPVSALVSRRRGWAVFRIRGRQSFPWSHGWQDRIHMNLTASREYPSGRRTANRGWFCMIARRPRSRMAA